MKESIIELNDLKSGWEKYINNPVIGHEGDFCFDNHVLKVNDHYRMYFSWRNYYSIAMVESEDGLNWSKPKIILRPRDDIEWEEDVNRPSIVYKDNIYHMWYSAQTTGVTFSSDKWTEAYYEASKNKQGTSTIGYAYSEDGVNWKRLDTPVLKSEDTWELKSLMNPSVIWDGQERIFKMWYSGGEWFEPNSVGYATSEDGVSWIKYKKNPIFFANANNSWEKDRIGGPHVVKTNEWYYLFYIGYEDLFKAKIGLARSKNGIEEWERHRENPIISPDIKNNWEADAVYKPFVIYEPDLNRWIMWYNARKDTTERIGVAFHKGKELTF